ncbi:MAG: 6-O-methylguanine DNA methyltransferase [Chloroflexi bacterium]|nr:6-O-methylguanine DNA methyltransferase [Chloroflexota bacterium]
MADELSLNEKIYAVIQEIPPGRIATYGQIAAIVGPPADARIVGYALAAMGHQAAVVPWQRVINAQGKISTAGARQRQILEAEGILFDRTGKADLDRFGWQGPDPAWARQHGFHPLPPGTPPGRAPSPHPLLDLLHFEDPSEKETG